MATSMVKTAMTDVFPVAQMCGAFIVYFGLIYLCATIVSHARTKRRQLRVAKVSLK